MLLWYFLKRLSQVYVHVHGSGEMEDFEGCKALLRAY